MSLRLLARAAEIYRREGFLTVASKTFRLIQRNVLSGGISSNSSIESVTGLLRPFYNFYFRVHHGEETNILGEDWDTLILLDACRYDDFADRNHLNGELEYRLSNAADSREFVQKNFLGETLHDTVYVTANPHVHLIDDGTFHAVIKEPLFEWDDELNCVKPGVVTAAAVRAHEKFDNKRIIVHYMQPHDPPLGSTGDEIREQMDLGGVGTSEQSNQIRLFEAVANGQVDIAMAREAYRETLDIVLEEVEDLIKRINGRIVVSADHGEMFGEQPYPILGKLYEHYLHPHTKELCVVPWLIIEKESRDITSDTPVKNEGTTTADIEEKLHALGYK